MGILLIVLSIWVIILLATFFNRYDGYRADIMIPAAVVGAVIYLFILAVSVTISYENYIANRVQYDSLIHQYRGAITMYEEKATLNIKKAAVSAMTDVRYNGYQQKMGDFIMDLRKEVVDYNRVFLSKKYMKKNFFYNWFVVAPDPDMKVVDIIDSE